MGYSPEWIFPPPIGVTPISQRTYSTAQQHIYQKEIFLLLQSGAIQEIDPMDPCLVSNLFLVPKKNGLLRSIIDLRTLNQYVKYFHFKMESIDLVKSLLRREITLSPSI